MSAPIELTGSTAVSANQKTPTGRGYDEPAARNSSPPRPAVRTMARPRGGTGKDQGHGGRSDPAGGGDGLGGRLAVGGHGEAGALEVVHVDVGGLGGAGGGGQRRGGLRPPPV